MPSETPIAEIADGLAPSTFAAVFAAVPLGAPGSSPKEIHEAVGCWSRVTVRHALRVMARAGAIIASGQPGAFRYWRSA